jgi:hypothetical protein
MGMLEENSADPFREWEEKHVITKGCRPIRNGQAHAFAGDHPAATNQEKRGHGSEPGEAV